MSVKRELWRLVNSGRESVMHGLPLRSDGAQAAQRLWNQGQRADALKLMEALTCDAEIPQWWVQRGIMEMELDMNSRALRSFRHAAALDPFDPYALGLQTAPLIALGKDAEAQAANKKALELEAWRGHPEAN